LNSRRAGLGSPSCLNVRRILLGTAGVLGLGLAMTLGASPASAQYPFWYRPVQRPPVYRHKLVRKHAEEASRVTRLPFGDIPKGPLQIFVSIDQQKLHFYSDGVHVADEPVATGVPGHLTPLGVFNVIQRDRYHHSNIYDNAPMPFMQRITWSGVALHEGVGLGHQASHGCIRMPHDFAARLWMLPTMGMGVIVAGPELQPEQFSDPHLFVHKDKPPTSAGLRLGTETAQTTNPATKTDATDAAAAPAVTSPAGAELASAADPKIGAAIAPSPDPAEQLSQATPATEVKPMAAKDVPAASDPGQPPSPTPDKSTAIAAPTPAAPTPATPASGTGAEPPKSAASEKTPAAGAAESVPASPAKAAAPAQGDGAATGAPAAAPAMPGKEGAAQEPAPSTSTAATPAEPDSSVNPASSADIAAPVEDIPLPLSKPSRIAEGSGGPLAIFISRKAGKIYVRQNFTPLFDAPVTIEHPDQPLGTHVFTALDYLPDHSAFRWTVVNLPAERPKAAEHWKYVRDRFGRVRRVRVEEPAAAVEVGPPETAQGALARIEIPQDVIDQISRLIVPGSSLTISDQGLGSETGDGTDFIVVTR
jgi:L,D-transpeptidase catalytic domain